MKKILLSLSLCLLLCGCGNKLTCTYEDKDNGTVKYTISFKDDKVVKMVQKITFKDKDEVEDACEYLKDSDSKKVKCSGKSITITTTDEDELPDGEYTKEDLKEELEEEGFKCK